MSIEAESSIMAIGSLLCSAWRSGGIAGSIPILGKCVDRSPLNPICAGSN